VKFPSSGGQYCLAEEGTEYVGNDGVVEKGGASDACDEDIFDEGGGNKAGWTCVRPGGQFPNNDEPYCFIDEGTEGVGNDDVLSKGDTPEACDEEMIDEGGDIF